MRLHDLLTQIFDKKELRRWVHDVDASLLKELNYDQDLATFALDVATAMERQGLLTKRSTWEKLGNARSHAWPRIRELAAHRGVDLGVRPPSPIADERTRPLLFVGCGATVLSFAVVFFLWVTAEPGPTPTRTRHLHQSFDGPAPPDGEMIDDLFHLGEQDDVPWAASLDEGAYQLCNPDDPTRVYRNRLDTLDKEGSQMPMGDARMTIRVVVQPPNTTHSGVGILFRADEAGDRWLAYVANAGRGLSLLQWYNGQLDVIWSGEGKAQEGFRDLAMEGDGPSVRLFVDGELVHTQQSLPFEDGDVGVFAYSTGCFVIDELSVYGQLER
ncbi:MAG: hypothetical protein KTR31_10245 [Myxococcales bacterium]|nr:hypothetical protein [Myxococcales bacterium]